MPRHTLCDSNYGERDTSFAPLVAIGHDDGTVTVINTAARRGHGYVHETYPTIDAAAAARDFVRRWLRDAKERAARYPDEARGWNLPA